MKHILKNTIEHYSEFADAFSHKFDSLSFDEIHTDVMKNHIPDGVNRLLEIGAGNGRDAEGFARRGFSVTAVEPADGLRLIGEDRTRNLPVVWINDALPDLASVSGTWPFIFCNAVFQHIMPELRAQCLRRLIDLLAPSGRVYLTLRQGPSEADRPTYRLTKPELEQLLSELDLPCSLEFYTEEADVLRGISGVSFISLRLDKKA